MFVYLGRMFGFFLLIFYHAISNNSSSALIALCNMPWPGSQSSQNIWTKRTVTVRTNNVSRKKNHNNKLKYLKQKQKIDLCESYLI